MTNEVQKSRKQYSQGDRVQTSPWQVGYPCPQTGHIDRQDRTDWTHRQQGTSVRQGTQTWHIGGQDIQASRTKKKGHIDRLGKTLRQAGQRMRDTSTGDTHRQIGYKVCRAQISDRWH